MGDDADGRAFFNDKFFINLLLSVIGFLLIAGVGMVYNQEQSTQAELTAHIIDAAQKASAYVKKDDLEEVNARLQRIEDKLDRKVDKP